MFRLQPGMLDFAEVSGTPERLLGFPLEEWFRPRFWTGRLHPEDREMVRGSLQEWAETRRDGQLDYRIVDAAGRTVWVHQLIAAGRDAGQDDSIRGVLLDITDRIARETEAANAAFPKSELFRIVVEELAPPMRAISVYCEMLERHLAAQHDDVGSDHAVGLREELQRLDDLLGQLMRTAQSGASSG